jgi:hypothetical protein
VHNFLGGELKPRQPHIGLRSRAARQGLVSTPDDVDQRQLLCSPRRVRYLRCLALTWLYAVRRAASLITR